METMKNIIRKIIGYMAVTVCTVLLAGLVEGCTKEPLDDDVEGFWQLKTFVVKETGDTVTCHRLYYGITRMVTEVSEKQGTEGYGCYIGRTEYRKDGTQLVLSDFKVRANTSDNGQDAPVEMLRHFGIDSQKETVFDIVHCDGRTMTLESDYARLELRKF